MYTFLNKNNANGFSQVEIAKKIGINVSTINRIINGKQQCSKIMAYCISKAISENAEIKDYFKKEK